MEIGDRIRDLRKTKGITMNEIADKLGVQHQTVYKYEKGLIKNIPLAHIEKIAEMLDCSEEYLCGWKEKEPTNEGKLGEEIIAKLSQLSDAERAQALVYVQALLDTHKT